MIIRCLYTGMPLLVLSTLVYVDDIIIISNSQSLIQQIITHMNVIICVVLVYVEASFEP